MEITVIIPTFNRSDLLKETVESVLAQSYPVKEIIIIDDHSDNDHAHENQRIADAGPGVEYRYMDVNKGVAAARNYGIEKATGDFILFIDDDDLLHPLMIETALSYFQQDESLDVSVCLYEIFFSPDYQEFTIPLSRMFNHKLLDQNPLRLIDDKNIVPKEMLGRKPIESFLKYLIPVNSCLIRRETIGNIRFSESLPQGEDTFFWLSLAKKGCRFARYDNVHVFVRRHGGNTTRSKSRYYRDITACYEEVLNRKIPETSYELFIVHLKLFLYQYKNRDLKAFRHLFYILKKPGLLFKELFEFISVRLIARKKLFKFYYLD